MSPPPPCYSDLALNQTFQQWIALSTNTLPLFLIAEGYPAVQCQFPRHQAHRSPSPTLTPPANSITAHQRLARCSAKVLPIAASTARGLVWKKTPVAALHLVYICWHIQYISLHANISLKHAATTKSCIYQSSFFSLSTISIHVSLISSFSPMQCTVARHPQTHAPLPVRNPVWKKRRQRIRRTEETYKEVSDSPPSSQSDSPQGER